MRYIALAFLLALALAVGCVHAYPLHGGNVAVNCTLFGVDKYPIPGQDPNATVQEYVLKVDIGMIGVENATYQLIDSKDKVYSPDLSRTNALQPARELLAFVVPRESLFKQFKVSPQGGEPFSINWWNTPKKILGDITLRYYGVIDARMNPNEQSAAYDVKITNNGTAPIYISPENFTLLDQWGWEYYTIDGFRPTNLDAKMSARVKVNFSSISPLSKPSLLVYDYLTSHPIAIDLEKDTGQLSDAQVYGTNLPSSSTSTVATTTSLPTESTAASNATPVVQSAPTTNSSDKKATTKQSISSSMQSLNDQINASKSRLSNMGPIGGNSAVGSNIETSVNEALARLAKMSQGLPKGQNSSQNNSSQSTS